MTVEAIEEKENISNNGYSLAKKNEHFLLQLYGRCSIILGSLLVGLLNVFIFSGTEGFSKEQMHNSYETVYFLALFIPLLSVSGIVTSYFFNKNYNHHSLSKRKTNKLDSKIFIISILLLLLQFL